MKGNENFLLDKAKHPEMSLCVARDALFHLKLNT